MELNIFMTSGQVLWQWGFLKITKEGLYMAAFMALRLVLLIIGSSLLTLTTKHPVILSKRNISNHDFLCKYSYIDSVASLRLRMFSSTGMPFKPHVLILDEPTAGLDPGAHKDILSMIEQVHESKVR
mgnify:CR=1 FL=1